MLIFVHLLKVVLLKKAKMHTKTHTKSVQNNKTNLAIVDIDLCLCFWEPAFCTASRGLVI